MSVHRVAVDPIRLKCAFAEEGHVLGRRYQHFSYIRRKLHWSLAEYYSRVTGSSRDRVSHSLDPCQLVVMDGVYLGRVEVNVIRRGAIDQ